MDLILHNEVSFVLSVAFSLYTFFYLTKRGRDIYLYLSFSNIRPNLKITIKYLMAYSKRKGEILKIYSWFCYIKKWELVEPIDFDITKNFKMDS